MLRRKNTWSYLLYAAGEILLVVFGILIAIQVDDWNEEQSRQKEALVLYRNTEQQLLEDRQNLEVQIAFNDLLREQFEFAIFTIDQDDRLMADSLTSIATRLVEFSDFDREKTIYESLVNSGNIKLLKNESFKKGLRSLEETYRYVNRMEAIHYDAIFQMIPYMSGNFNITSNTVENMDVLFSMQFQNFFAISLRIMDDKDDTYQRAMNEINALVSLIRQELEQQNN